MPVDLQAPLDNIEILLRTHPIVEGCNLFLPIFLHSKPPFLFKMCQNAINMRMKIKSRGRIGKEIHKKRRRTCS